MSTLIAIAPCVYWQHKESKQRVSLFGALPCPIADFEKVTKGFTTVWANGTRGHGAKPFQTMEEAKAYVESYNANRKAYGLNPVAVTFPQESN